MKYLLDTNICIYLIKNKPMNVQKYFNKIELGNIFLSSISVAEIYYGIAKSLKKNENLIAFEQFLLPLEILDFNKADSLEYGKIRSNLEVKGKLIGAMDMLIAAQAKSNNLILVTNNEKEFKRIEGLKIENWV